MSASAVRFSAAAAAAAAAAATAAATAAAAAAALAGLATSPWLGMLKLKSGPVG